MLNSSDYAKIMLAQSARAYSAPALPTFEEERETGGEERATEAKLHLKGRGGSLVIPRVWLQRGTVDEKVAFFLFSSFCCSSLP